MSVSIDAALRCARNFNAKVCSARRLLPARNTCLRCRALAFVLRAANDCRLATRDKSNFDAKGQLEAGRSFFLWHFVLYI